MALADDIGLVRHHRPAERAARHAKDILLDRFAEQARAAELQAKADHARQDIEEPARADGIGQPIELAKRAFGHVAERSEEHTSELQSPMRNSYAVFCLKKKKQLK